MQPLWTFSELSAALGVKPEGGVDRPVAGVSIDTRTLQPGDLFVALKDQRDGHDFVSSAFEAGAAAALVVESYRRQPKDGALLRVPDTLRGLEALGRAARARINPDARVVAVTGSAGKTGTKEMLRACLAHLGTTHASEKSYNNHWGVPLTLARMSRETRFSVFEIGMNHAGEIRPLTKMVRPHAAIVTTVEAVHLEYFPSVQAIADAKGEIFEGLVPGGTAVIKYDNPHAGRLTSIAKRFGAKPVTFGFSAGADVRGDDLKLGYDGSALTVRFGERRIPLQLAMPGRHIAENALAVVAAIDAIGADVEKTLSVLANLQPPSGRGARSVLHIEGGEALLIDESYNANPASMRAALAALASVPRQKFSRRIAVLGDMLELGSDAPALHQGLKEAVEDAGIDLIFACGPHMKGLYDALPKSKKGGYAAASSSLPDALLSNLRRGDVIMVKASNGTRLGPVVAALKAQFGNDGSVS
ncbi:UDP-N-acetylmuramoylalanyl-D-glutamyl-2, 6-diaminopimelate/D-alanyl-D-alanyl ligase [Hyphomicrobium denitrificans 1NES1]|uniref:UDP-N-acetylmuramoyl-tripeptide--D-alanyl-D-alanine ligase n=1 Tax=Hyphomicrobium denitrificans 1NES1 TaxID=670307 RepID=N0B7B7_9HYPH|nr:UDP-N-acetylmuramoylalanyl-D-glutamyl-2,6-diaminopimelate--D-alanyl-D-alanine ligase [Hyphomicrobium denitrificans]AGK56431.1 UDP-N-acetylmuramoylalanyl-D-glutamyl-2, 6-diaminopimelate/D-alanyl-D-alanyl ligase [Hyphomicrobium denitrificans 1NES1]